MLSVPASPLYASNKSCWVICIQVTYALWPCLVETIDQRVLRLMLKGGRIEHTENFAKNEETIWPVEASIKLFWWEI